jgi:pimeloyl-ACP methyl ester carboxylesterase
MQTQPHHATLFGTFLLLACAAGAAACSKSTDDKKSEPLSPSDASAEAAGPAPVPPPEPDDCFMTGDAGFKTHHCEGLDFEVSGPDECLTHACGFITDIHGFGMNAELMEGHTHMRELGNAKGYIVMQPSAPGGVLTSAWNPANDAQVFAIMQRVMRVWHVDPKRVHVDGYSMGAWMTWRLVCAHSDVLASAAPIAGGLQPMSSCPFGPDGTGAPGEPATPAQQIPILYTHGKNDGLVNFAQAMAERDAVVAAWYPGVEPEVVMKDFDYEWDRYTNSDGNVFEFIQHDWECGFVLPLGGNNIALKGHCFPGSPAFLGCGRDTNGKLDGGVVYPFNWSETVLQFFVDHPKKN